MAGARRDLAVELRGMTELRRTFRRLEGDLDPRLRLALRDIADAVRDRARANTPRRSGALERSIRSGVTLKGASIRTSLAYGPVHEYGGTVGRGHSRSQPGAIRIAPSRFMQKGVEESRLETARELEQLLGRIAHDFTT